MSCNWPVDTACLPSVDASTPDAAKMDAAMDLAVSVLWALSGRRFGVCPVIVRPCPTADSVYTPWTIAASLVTWSGTNWINVSCGCGSRCSNTAPSVIHLAADTAQPVVEIVEIRLAGELMDPSEYTLEGDMLYRNGGTAWPSQNLRRPLPETGTWSVTYTRGVEPPPGTAALAGLLTKEFYDACSGGKCRLPRRVQNVTRNGVSYQMVDPTDIYTSGKTGISEIDLWLSSVNPEALASGPTVR